MRLDNEICVAPGFYITTCNTSDSDTYSFKRETDSSYIQFHFCLKGNAVFLFNAGNYRLPLAEDGSLLLYNPKQDLPIDVLVAKESWLVSVIISINKFHSLFSMEADFITFLNTDNKEKKYYQDGTITPSMSIVLNQILGYNLHPSVRALYFKAKAYELISLYFNRPAEGDIAQCPFLADETNVVKLKQAKKIIIERMVEPPTLQELADEIGLSLNKLKEGFKQIYGDSVFSFLVDYKMEVARKLLAQGTLNVNEVGLKVGYSTSSHFIAAFKKKFGTTPKKYVQSLD